MMNRSATFIFSLLLLPFLSKTQSFFTINVGTFLDARSAQFADAKSLGFLYAYELEGNLSQVYVGGYENRADAEKVATALRARGFTSAFVEERPLKDGQSVTVIQIAARDYSKGIQWEQFEAVGNLMVTVSGDNVRIVTGPYASVLAARDQLTAVRNLGFADAFIKNVSNVTLIPVDEFETGLKKPLIPLTLDNQPARTQPAVTQREVPGAYETAGERITPKTPEQPAAPPAPNVLRSSAASKVPPPEIRPRVKRRSVLDLQKVMKAEGAYTSSLDGYYGAGTASAYEQMLNTSRQLKKYRILAANSDPLGQTAPDNRLQQAINNLLDDPAAPMVVESNPLPVAKGYRAYLLFRTLGPGSEVNSLMNAAIREAFEGKKLTNKIPFDFRATYAYEDLDQLILHLHYLHGAPDNTIAAPCWLYQEHPKETARAHAAFASYGGGDFRLQTCDQFLDWEEIRVMQSIAADLNADKQFDQAKLSAYASARAQLFLAPRALDKDETKAAEAWNQRLWDGLNTWSGRDPMHEQIVTAMKVVYFQSQIRLEDYFMNKGFSPDDAKGLALATLKTLVGYHLERFV